MRLDSGASLRNLKQSWGLLLSHERRRYRVAFLVSSILGVFDVLIVALTLGIVQSASSSDAWESKQTILFVTIDLSRFSTVDPMLRIVVLFGLLLFVIAVRNSASYLVKTALITLDGQVSHRLSTSLLGQYLCGPFDRLLQYDSPVILRNIESSRMITSHCLRPWLEIGSQLINLILILAILTFANVLATLFTTVLLIAIVVSIYQVFGSRYRQLGERERALISERARSANHAILGAREIKVAHREDVFLQRFSELEARIVSCQRKVLSLNELSPLLVEGVAVLALFFISLMFWVASNSGATLLAYLTVFAVVSIRMIPSFSRILAYKQAIVYGQSFVSTALDDLQRGAFTETERAVALVKHDIGADVDAGGSEPHFDRLHFQSVSYHYPNSDRKILENVNLEIPGGSRFGIIGLSGSGKSTLVDLLLGLLTPTAGEVLVRGRPLKEQVDLGMVVVGYVPQFSYFSEGSIRSNIAFGTTTADDDERLWAVLRSVQLEKLVQSLEKGLDTEVGELGKRLSGGERQRLGLARALFRKPNLLVLDEATSSLDSPTERQILASLNNLNHLTIITVAHRPSALSSCDAVALISGSTIQEVGDPDQMIQIFELNHI
jgi:ABC-type multidrug transport system fused ATPase/permease subunit